MTPPEEAAFWAKIAENPADDLPRLVFADWLDERDDPRAAWMRDGELARYMGPGVDSPLPALLVALQSDEVEDEKLAWYRAQELFVRVGEPAVAPLLELCRGEVRTSDMAKAGEALARFDGDLLAPHVDEFIRLLPLTTSIACEALTKIGPAAAPALPHILEAERIHHIPGGTLAAFARAIGPAAGPAVPRLIELLLEDRYDALHAHGPALVAIGSHTLDRVFDALNRLDDERVGDYSRVLGLYGEAAVPRLTAALDEPPGARRTVALLALGLIAPTAVVPHMAAALRTEAEPVQELILDSLREMGPTAFQAVPAIREVLQRSDSYGVQESAVRALAEIAGDGQVPEVIEQLASPDPAVRLASLRVLGHFASSSSEDVVEPLRPLLADPDPRVRTSAADVLAQVKSAAAPAVPELLVAMRDPVEAVRIAATRTVDGMQHEEPRMLGALLAALADESEEVRHAAAHGLLEWGRLYPEHAAAVFARLTDPDPYVARAAATLMGKATEPTPELIAHFRNTIRTAEDAADRVTAATSLAKLKITDPDVLAEVFAVFDETEEQEMAWPLVEIGDAAIPYLVRRLETLPARRYDILSGYWWNRSDMDLTPLVGVTIDLLSDPEDLVRQQAVQLLQKIGKPAASAALPRLLELFDDEYFGVRWHAVTAAATVAPVPADVLDPLVRVYAGADHYLRKSVIEALAILDVPASAKLPHFLTALRDDDTDVVKQSLEGIAALGSEAAAAVPDLIPLLLHTGEVRIPAIAALAKIGDAATVVPALLPHLDDTEDGVRQSTVEAIGSFGPAAAVAVPELTRLLTDDDEDLRRAAAEALAQLGAAEAAGVVVDDLVQKLAAPNGYDRLAAAQSLGALGEVAAPAVPALARALRDPAWGDVRTDTRKRFTVMGMILMPMEQIEALGEMDQRMFLPEVLKQIGTPDVYPVLAEALSDPNPVVAGGAENALEDSLPACAEFVRGLLDHPDEDVRRRANAILNPSTGED